MKIVDLKCAVIGGYPVVRVVTDEGLDGFGEVERSKHYVKPQVLFYRDRIIGMDPTDVARVMQGIRRLGGFKPWGSAVSAIEMALWDIAGKAAGVPVYKLLGGKVRDRVRVYQTYSDFPMADSSPESYADNIRRTMALPEGFTIIKRGVAFHSGMPYDVPDFFYGEVGASQEADNVAVPHPHRGLLTERGLQHIVDCATAMKEVTGDRVGLALDCGPGMLVPDAIRLARAVEPLGLMWLEDMITGDYMPYVMADQYRRVRDSTSTPIHTGEQIYLREHFKELFEKQAVDVVGPDPADVGGIAELKWVAEYADLHGILIAPHGVLDGLFGIAAHVHLAATLPQNYIALEYPGLNPDWWYDIFTGLPDPIVRDGFIDVWDTPGLGVDFIVEEARRHLSPEDEGFLD